MAYVLFEYRKKDLTTCLMIDLTNEDAITDLTLFLICPSEKPTASWLSLGS